MAHEVETMAYRNEVPWHGLGTFVPQNASLDEMMELGRVNWEVRLRKMSTDSGSFLAGDRALPVAIPNHRAIVRVSDNKVLDVVGPVYQVIQNKEALAFVKDFVESGDAHIETIGSLRGGQYVWCLASLNKDFIIGRDDKVKGYLLILIPHKQGASIVFKFTNVRVVCNNTLQLAMKEGGYEYRVQHNKQYRDRLIDAPRVLGLARDTMDKFEETANRLHEKQMDSATIFGVFTKLFDPDGKVQKALDERGLNIDSQILERAPFLSDVPKRFQKVIDSYFNAPGAEEHTAWGVLNAVTYNVDHEARGSRDDRLTSAWLGGGAALKQKALDLLVAA